MEVQIQTGADRLQDVVSQLWLRMRSQTKNVVRQKNNAQLRRKFSCEDIIFNVLDESHNPTFLDVIGKCIQESV